MIDARRSVAPDLYSRERTPGPDWIRLDVHVLRTFVGHAGVPVLVLGDEEVAVPEGCGVPDRVGERYLEAVVSPDPGCCQRCRRLVARANCHAVRDEAVNERGDDELSGARARAALEFNPGFRQVRPHLR